ncbi:ABC transporter ATP-binding protein [Phaeobacter sp. S60]|uniref:ABC transporter ATP-binding protein n=1 Tax=Phaeobacter sp. S60 TaxID=1569353 RepID=UPI00058E958E|nr:ABC transporter ATP-binding protein [Phaeobacter sp. S60]KII15568.1 peptide ABC transporter ATP-binding protein [Phaeobacter sp. S60]
MSDPILQVEHLCIDFKTKSGPVRVLSDVSFTLSAGETLGIVGESGCGKSMTSLAVMGLIPKPNGKIVSGRISYRGEDLVQVPEKRMRQIRGGDISMIFQEPMTSLNPVFSIGKQIGEALRLHEDLSGAEIHDRVIDVLARVGIPDPLKRVNDFPHQMSGGMRQRVMIAMALVCKPRIIIADEPTTALDVTVQAQILELILQLQEEENTAVILISHDMGVISQVSDRVLVMYAGRTIEEGDCVSVVQDSAHPYTKGLISCIPDIDRTKDMSLSDRLPIIEGIVPNLKTIGSGCAFAPRCHQADEACKSWETSPVQVAETHLASCRKVVGSDV